MDESKREKRKRLNRSKAASRSLLPSSIVCSALAEEPGTLELGVLFSVLVLVLYFYGCYQTVSSLPKAPGTLNFAIHIGHNLNLAHPSEWHTPAAVGVAPTEPRGLNVDETKQQQHFMPLEKKIPLQQQQLGQPKPQLTALEQNAPTIPRAVWPVSLRNEPDNVETLIHPGDLTTKMAVPKFWSAPIHQNKLMSRETALRIGSCIEPDAFGNFNRGDECPVDKRTIYVGIASFRDFECRSTAESIFLRAKHPERIRIGVVDQIVDGEDSVCNAPIVPCESNPNQGLCKYKDQIDVYQMDAELSIGPVFARHIGYRMYRGEYYATQSDAHVTYTQDWDADIISQLQSTGNEMAVLSTYLTDVQGSIDENGHSLRDTRPIMCNTIYEGGPQGMHLRHASQPEREPSIHGTPQLQPWWAAGYSFSRGHFIVNVPYDWMQPMIFQGEEMSIGIRGFTIGYDFYAPERSVCFHHYAVGKNAKIRNRVHHFWENSDQYAGTGRGAMQRLLGIVHMNPEINPKDWNHVDEDIYGVGGVRTPEKFYETFGIHVMEKTIEGHLCSFVDSYGRMHIQFSTRLRRDGMGIDYSRISYKFKDPRPGEE
jgi:[Skp1-protein]-hydroxyproline N-acetylglucosaminyltransferase